MFDNNKKEIKNALKIVQKHRKNNFCKRSLVLNTINKIRKEKGCSRSAGTFMTPEQFNKSILNNKDIFETTNCSIGLKEQV